MARDEPAQPELKLHAYVVLGMLRVGVGSGYDIKQLVDLIARHFWTISYPQIYPQLDHLEQHGLVAGRDDSTSGRRRRIYSITPAGRRELDRWLADPEAPSLEIRDVGLLKLMVADDDGVALEQLSRIRKRSEDAIAHLESRSRPAAEAIEGEGNPFPLVSVELGIELHRALLRTCRTLERRVSRATSDGP